MRQGRPGPPRKDVSGFSRPESTKQRPKLRARGTRCSSRLTRSQPSQAGFHLTSTLAKVNKAKMNLRETIAHYRITAKLSVGGMGEVYRATDTKLGRDVAIKIIPEAFAQDADRMARFAREAQVLAALNHPNIAAIYGV